ncbi:hypothetical protein TPHA_0I03220 [Tetrapisispora phaffii CBS 4417]|uniref:DNA polymerase epsilon subunit B n=1 Tax=Tetrapisispora phaffii (strain ATCC 24235 / CBS 4417 / NBRC 1672 / NRRL Y-8282 / UCD 70-5) TaxID=1071381 RepID=G8BY45_TETPH|nr:hypothetical protein TPHA_0I03220 [Tetrapisispora phaffii CBS 4417]CCE64823.1 hypothetical protein TPHA_0I03220 [Tetrapisispora phaffii CBS 4417]
MFSSGNVLPVKIQPPLLRPLAYRVLSKKFGLNIKSDGLAELAEFIGNAFGMEWKKSSETVLFLEQFATVWKQQERGLFIDSTGTKSVISEIKERSKSRIKVRDEPDLGPAQEPKKAKTLDNFLLKNVLQQKNVEVTKQETDSEDIPMDDGIEIISEHTSLSNNGTGIEMSDGIETSDGIVIKEEEVQDITDVDPISNYSIPQIEPIEQIEAEEVTEDEMEQLNWRDYFKIINVDEQQNFSYNPRKLQFIFKPSFKKPHSNHNSEIINNSNLKLQLPDIQSKLAIFSTRYYLLRDRIMRNEAFQNNDSFNPLSSMVNMKNALQNNDKSELISNMSLTPIKTLLGRNGQNFLILGMLRVNAKGNWCLEDPSGDIEVDLSQTLPTAGLYYVPGAIVLTEGIYYSATNTFHVTSMTHPPCERRDVTLEAIGNIDLLGIHGISTPNYIAKLDDDLKIRLHYLEKDFTDHRFAIMGGDMFLNELQTLSALRKVFSKLNEDPPIMIILQGSFSSTPVHASTNSKSMSISTQYKNNFDSLASLLSEFEDLINYSTFLFIPGVNDPWSSMVTLGSTGLWPQKPIPNHFTTRINRICRHVIWGSNPTRIAYLSQEIVIMRDNICGRFKRNSVQFRTVEEKEGINKQLKKDNEKSQLLDDDDIPMKSLSIDPNKLPARVHESRKIVKTILDQGHLSPFTPDIRPIAWGLDHSLTLYPIPSTLILCDQTAPQFELTYNGCKAFNPGKFISNNRARFLAYTPSLKKVQEEELYF